MEHETRSMQVVAILETKACDRTSQHELCCLDATRVPSKYEPPSPVRNHQHPCAPADLLADYGRKKKKKNQ